MAESLTIARPYADAAFGIARETGTLPQWSDALNRLAQVMASAEARGLVSNPRLGPAQIAALIADAAGQLGQAQRNFVQVLAENERLEVMGDIEQQFRLLRNRHEEVLDVTVQTAYPLDEGQVADIVATLEKKYGRKVRATTELEDELIGGVCIRIGDEMIDASVRGKLAKLAATLKN
ncbi:MAG: F0F1 ATP synthase subunit delta [Lautropia sp.]